jgi:hypothetical protein
MPPTGGVAARGRSALERPNHGSASAARLFPPLGGFRCGAANRGEQCPEVAARFIVGFSEATTARVENGKRALGRRGGVTALRLAQCAEVVNPRSAPV